MIESVTLVRESAKAVGVRTYADSLGRALRAKGVKVHEHSWWKRDFHLLGRNFGAVATPLLSRLRAPPPADVTHATFSNLTSGECNVVTVMDLVWRGGGYPEARILNSLFCRKMRRSTIIVPTHVIKGQVERWLKIEPERIFVTHLAPSTRIYSDSNIERYPSLVLMVGDANERKRTLEAVKALKGLDVDLVHVGSPWNSTTYGRACIQAAADRGVRFVDRGRVSPDELRIWYNRAQLLLYPSTEEGFGLPPLEAAACGLQSVVGSSPVFREVMGEDCVPCDGRAPVLIQQAVRQALKSPLPRASLKARAANYSWAKCAEETLRAYEAAL